MKKLKKYFNAPTIKDVMIEMKALFNSDVNEFYNVMNNLVTRKQGIAIMGYIYPKDMR